MKNNRREVTRVLMELMPKVEKALDTNTPLQTEEMLNRVNEQIQKGDIKANAELAIILLYSKSQIGE